MTTVAIIGASGRIGRETAALFLRQAGNAKIIGTYLNNKPELEGASLRKVDVANQGDLVALCEECDIGIDCCGPSSRYGLHVPEVFSAQEKPFVSLGHVFLETAKFQVFQAGALPGLLAAAFLLAKGSPAEVEVIYELGGTLTPIAAYDVLASDYSSSLTTSPVEPRSVIRCGRNAVPYRDESIAILSRAQGIQVASFSIWPEATRESFSTARNIGLERGAMMMSSTFFASGAAGQPTKVHIVPYSDDGKAAIGKLVTIPSLYTLSAAGAWLAYQEELAVKRGYSHPYAILMSEDPERFLRKALSLSGCSVVDMTYGSSLENAFSEEGEL